MAVDTRPYVTFSDPTLWQRVFRIRPTRKDSISKALPWSVSRLESTWSHRNSLIGSAPQRPRPKCKSKNKALLVIPPLRQSHRLHFDTTVL